MAILEGSISSNSMSLNGDVVNKATEWGLISGNIDNQTDLVEALDAKQDEITTTNKLSASLVSGLSTVATSGSYNDLTNKPTISDATISIKKNGALVQSFDLNQDNDQDINITVPTKTSDIVKDDVYTKTESDTLLNGKVDKVAGKGLSTNDYTNEDKTKVQNAINKDVNNLTNYYLKTEDDTLLAGKVDKVSGKQLSTNDYTNEDKAKVQSAVQPSAISDMATKTWVNLQGFITNAVNNLLNYFTKTETTTLLNAKQNTLVSGTNIKTINSQSILGSGDIEVGGAVESVNGKTGVVVLDAEDVGALPSTTAIPSKVSDLTNDTGFITKNVNDLTNYSTTSQMNTAISSHHDDTKVNVETGKGLSTNDYTDSDKALVESALQPSALDDYSTTSEMNTAIANHHDTSKQDVISDLASIRSGASLGATALQSVPNTYRTSADQDVIDNTKVDKITGKGLSENDFTTTLKTKLDGISANAKNVSVSATGTSTDEVQYITIDGTEKKLAGGGGSVSGAVRYDIAQSLTDSEKLQARQNIGVSSEIYGIKRSLTTSSSAWSRTDSAVGLVANATHDGTVVVNDFNTIYPWSDIISVNMGNDGLITARYGDANFKFDGTNGDVMTYFPQFYWKRWQDSEYEYIQISKNNFDGASLSQGFYVGRYHTCTGANSYSNQVPQVGTNITTFRNQARAKGNGWGQLDFHYWLIQMLYLVEYANYNIKYTLGNGIQSIRYVGSDKALIAETSTNRIVIATDNVAYAVGITMNIGTGQGNPNIASYRKITSKEAYNDGTITGTAIYFDGNPVNVAVNNILWCGVQHNGQCDNLGMLSGCFNNDGRHAMIYRGVENYFANAWQFVDGLNIQNNVAYINYNQATYQVDKFDGDYQMVGYTNSTSNGYAKTFGYDNANPMVALTTSIGGASNTYISAYYYQNTGNRIASVGGAFHGGANGGFSWTLDHGSSDASIYFGSRLLKLTT